MEITEEALEYTLEFISREPSWSNPGDINAGGSNPTLKARRARLS